MAILISGIADVRSSGEDVLVSLHKGHLRTRYTTKVAHDRVTVVEAISECHLCRIAIFWLIARHADRRELGNGAALGSTKVHVPLNGAIQQARLEEIRLADVVVRRVVDQAATSHWAGVVGILGSAMFVREHILGELDSVNCDLDRLKVIPVVLSVPQAPVLVILGLDQAGGEGCDESSHCSMICKFGVVCLVKIS